MTPIILVNINLDKNVHFFLCRRPICGLRLCFYSLIGLLSLWRIPISNFNFIQFKRVQCDGVFDQQLEVQETHRKIVENVSLINHINSWLLYQTSDLLISQFVPANPSTHVHVYFATWSVQLALFWHGLLAHSLIS